MSYHLTTTGHIEILDQWGHGKNAKGNWANRPATIIVDDGDGHYTAWGYSGSIKDAMIKASRFDLERHRLSSGNVAVRTGNYVTIESAPEDFWIEKDGMFEPDLENNPNVIAY